VNTLYYSPGACSLGIHVLLEEIGTPYRAEAVDLRVPAAERQVTAINAKSKVPTLVRADGSVLTEFPAIAYWLARTNPAAHLLPDDAERGARALELMEYAVSTMHMQGFSRIYRPGNFAPSEADHDAVRARGRQILADGLALADRALQGKDYVVGEISIADAALFYVEFWAASRIGTDLPANCAAHFARMKARPAVAAVMKQEGLAT
jgi:glutathione S-transferase